MRRAKIEPEARPCTVIDPCSDAQYRAMAVVGGDLAREGVGFCLRGRRHDNGDGAMALHVEAADETSLLRLLQAIGITAL